VALAIVRGLVFVLLLKVVPFKQAAKRLRQSTD